MEGMEARIEVVPIGVEEEVFSNEGKAILVEEDEVSTVVASSIEIPAMLSVSWLRSTSLSMKINKRRPGCRTMLWDLNRRWQQRSRYLDSKKTNEQGLGPSGSRENVVVGDDSGMMELLCLVGAGWFCIWPAYFHKADGFFEKSHHKFAMYSS